MNIIKTAVITLVGAMTLASCSEDSVEESKSTKTLILYYSQTGTTKTVAKELKTRLGADIDSIVAEEPYNGSYQEIIDRCQKEIQENVLPKVKTNADLAKYDTIYLGYPIWFGTFARPMLSFVKQTKLDGKVIIPFCSFGSGGLKATSESLKIDQPNAKILTGYGVRNARIAAMPNEVDRFLKENKYVEGSVTPLPDFSEQKPLTDEEKEIFDVACGDYEFPLGTPFTVGSRKIDSGVEYKYTVQSQDSDGKVTTSFIYVIAPMNGKPEFTQVA